MADYRLSRGDLDGLWSFVGNKGEKSHPETEESGQFWRSTMIDIDTRVRAARGIAKTETEAALQVFETLQRRGHPEAPPPTVSDGWGGNCEAMVEVYGKVLSTQALVDHLPASNLNLVGSTCKSSTFVKMVGSSALN